MPSHVGSSISRSQSSNKLVSFAVAFATALSSGNASAQGVLAI
jgi:hypothetical protein